MTMGYSLMSFKHFRLFIDFRPKRWTIALCLFKIFGIFGKRPLYTLLAEG